jgi:hypothetical protein
MNPAQRFVDEEVPSRIRHLLPSALRRAYAAADQTIERDSYLCTPGGMIMLAASYELQELVKAGDLPFDGKWEFFARPTGKHFVMLTKRARITTSQVDDSRKRPRRAVFRENYAELNESSLFPDINEELARKQEEAERNRERRLLHILHGYQDLEFAHIAYPHPEKNRHIYRTTNLLRLPHEIASGLSPAEGPEESPNPETLENLERHLRDTDD